MKNAKAKSLPVRSGLSIGEALAFCSGKGVQITRQGLKWAAVTSGFWIGTGKAKEAAYDKLGLAAWVAARKQVAPEGWAKISEAVKSTGIPRDTIYAWINSGKVSVKSIGPGKGMIYVKLNEVQGIRKSAAEKHKGGADA